MNLLCIAGYLLFMSLAFDSSIVNAVVFYVTDQDNQLSLRSGTVRVAPVKGSGDHALTAVQFRVEKEQKASSLDQVKLVAGPAGEDTRSEQMAKAPGREAADDAGHEEIVHDSEIATFTAPPADLSGSSAESDDDEDGEGEGAGEGETDAGEDSAAETAGTSAVAMRKEPSAVKPLPLSVQSSKPMTGSGAIPGGKVSIVEMINSLPQRTWELDLQLNRYVVRYDKDTTIVLTIRPSLQHLLKNVFEDHRCKIGAGVIQDPVSGAILAMTSYNGHKALSPSDKSFKDDNWALRATFPVASIFKIITAAAGFTLGKVTPNSTVRLGKKSRMVFWEAFARSHNGVFGVVGRAVGQGNLQRFADAFGFNKPFFFDLPVTPSAARLPANSLKMGQAAAGLNKYFETSPIHVSSIISTVLNRGRLMKPYLVDYVMRQGKVIFRRQPFQLGQPISTGVSQQIYEMMKTTTTHGTGKRGFGGFSDCPELATLCGGKTGTLTGADPKYLFTWFGGFMRTTGRDLGLTILVGKGSGAKAATIAGKVAHKLLNKQPAITRPTVAKR
jgi:hypothetical protein